MTEKIIEKNVKAALVTFFYKSDSWKTDKFQLTWMSFM